MTVLEAFAAAQQCHAAGRFAEAETLYRQILQVAPRHADALHFLGVVTAQTGRRELGADLIQQSLQLAPLNAAYHDNLGTVWRELGRLDEAITCARRALELEPDAAETHNNLANALRDAGRLPEALEHYARALSLSPEYTEALHNRSLALRQANRLEEALACARRAVALAPAWGLAWTNLGNVLGDLGQVAEADAVLREALRRDPGCADAQSAYLFNLHYLPRLAAEAVAEAHRRWGMQYPAGAAKTACSFTGRESGARLRIGYVSPDFREHPVAFFIEGVLAAHDRAGFEIFAYDTAVRADETTRRLESRCEHWRRIAGLTDDEAAAAIRADGIDILVDLAGHTAGHRLGVFARRPAPVQVTYLGYCDTTGLPAMQARITDAFADPPGAADRLHTERLVRLPGCFTCYWPPDAAPPVEPSPVLARGYATFGSFHTLAKLNDPLLEWWAEILAGTPGSRLLLVAIDLRETAAVSRFVEFFAARGIARERLEFRGRTGFAAYLQMHADVDVLLDSHPFSGHTVSCHALWMGVPVVTLAGDRHCSRMVASLLHATDLAALIAQTPGEYVQRAVELAAAPSRLAALRAGLRAQVAASPLVDAAGFTRGLEAALRQLWAEARR
jgi:predicted O-linked N-acetylglucosamine transferase (SPINDLY family)